MMKCKKTIVFLFFVMVLLVLPPVVFSTNVSFTINSGYTTNANAEFQVGGINFSGDITPLQINFTIANQASLNTLIGILYLNSSDVPIGNATISNHKVVFDIPEGNRTAGGIYYVVLTDPITTDTKAFKSGVAPFHDNNLTLFCVVAVGTVAESRPSSLIDNCGSSSFIRSLSGMEFSSVEVPSVATDFQITAKDQYDSSISITNISIKITNSSSFSFNTTTVNGTILVLNSSFLFDKLYNIEFRSNDSNGYFNKTIFDINITNAGTLEGTIFQSVINLVTIDGLTNLTINSYSAQTNLSSVSTTIGTLLIETTQGIFALNVSSTGFDTLFTNYSILALQNNTINLSLGSIFTFKLIRESTNTVFDFNSTNSTVVNVFCPNETIILRFNTSSNITQIINCKFTLMQAVVDYGDLGSYFRTLIPSFSNKNITWYLIDLRAGDTAIQRIITLLDLTGEFANSILTVKRSVGGVIRTMIEQRFDISNNVNLFLVKDVLYSISINNVVSDIVLGNLIPTEAGTQTITLPKIEFVPQETVLGGNISWSYTFNVSQSLLRLQYEDKTNKTDLVRFTIFNETATGLSQLFTTESTNNASVTITFNQIVGNTTYVTELFVKHQVLTNFSESRVFFDGGDASVINFDGWTPAEQVNFKKLFAWGFLAIWGLMFTRKYMGIGMTSLVAWLWIFQTWKWIEVDGIVFGFVVLLAVVGWIVDSMRRN